MRTRATDLAAQVRQTLPEGTGAVGAGLVVSAITSYVFVVVSLNALDGDAKAAFSAFWAVIFVAGPGFFLPLEQEVGRALAHRRAQGLGGGPLITRAAKLGGIITVLMVIAAFATAGLLDHQLYHGDWLFVAAVAIGLVGFYVMHLTRGVLAGEGRFRAYGELLAAEGVLRLAGGLVLAVVGVDRAGGYAVGARHRPLLRCRRGASQAAGDAAAGACRSVLGAVGVARLAPARLGPYPAVGLLAAPGRQPPVRAR